MNVPLCASMHMFECVCTCTRTPGLAPEPYHLAGCCPKGLTFRGAEVKEEGTWGPAEGGPSFPLLVSGRPLDRTQECYSYRTESNLCKLWQGGSKGMVDGKVEVGNNGRENYKNTNVFILQSGK